MKEQIHIERKVNSSFEGNTFVISDLHCPYEHTDSIESAKKMIRLFKPDRLIINGDAADCYLASRFVEATLGKAMLGDTPDISRELKHTVEVLDSLADECPDKCELIFVCGNHEFRITRQLDKIRHIVGENYDPLRIAFASSRHNKKYKHWEVSRDYPHGRYVICDDPNHKVVVKHSGKGTGLNYASALWRHGYAANESYIIGDTHKTMSFEGRCAPNPMMRDDRFVVGTGYFGDPEKTAFSYIEETSLAWWDRSVALINQTKNRFVLDIEYL